MSRDAVHRRLGSPSKAISLEQDEYPSLQIFYRDNCVSKFHCQSLDLNGEHFETALQARNGLDGGEYDRQPHPNWLEYRRAELGISISERAEYIVVTWTIPGEVFPHRQI